MLVTDRRRLVADTGAPLHDWGEALTAQIRGAVAGGVDLVQVREPDLDAPTLIQFLLSVFAGVPGSRERVVVNDQLDVARAAGARGIHLPERSTALGDVRALVSADKQWVTGRSVHSVRSVADSSGVSYLLAGTVLPSGSKPDGWRTLGWAGLRSLVAAANGIPVLGIGGLTAEDIPALVASGATGIAGIGCFLPSGRGELTEFVHDRVRAMRLAFDTPEVVSYTGEPDR